MLKDLQENWSLDLISGFEECFEVSLPKAQQLDFGENEHQKAALYGRFFDAFKLLSGKELNFHDIMNASFAGYLMGEFEQPTVALVKNMNPYYVASGSDLEEILEKIPLIYDCVLIANQTITEDLVKRRLRSLPDLIIAPAFQSEALALLKKRKIKLLEAKAIDGPSNLMDIRSVINGVLLQDRDFKSASASAGSFRVVTAKQPTSEEWQDAMFAWRVVKHARSHAVVLAKDYETLAMGVGQFSAEDALEVACALVNVFLPDNVLASDSVIHSTDFIDEAAQMGVYVIIQPGGSKNDAVLIDYAERSEISMIFTGKTYFKY